MKPKPTQPTDIPRLIAQLQRRKRELKRLAKVQVEVNDLEICTGIGLNDLTGPVRVLAEVASMHYRVPVVVITGRSRESEAIIPRHVVFYLLRKIIGARYAAIARAFARDHATIMWGVRSIQNRCDTDPSFARDLGVVEQQARAMLVQSVHRAKSGHTSDQSAPSDAGPTERIERIEWDSNSHPSHNSHSL